MYATPHPHQYAYAAAPVPAPTRQYSSTSSAFSSSANPDEDWTKISDLAERRRIQNRIAQRNYRKKLKRRLEDLERRAGTTDGAATDKPTASTTKTTKRTAGTKKQQHAQQSQQQQQVPLPQAPQQSQPQQLQQPQPRTGKPVFPSPEMVSTPQFTPPMTHDDEYLFSVPIASYGGERERSNTPPSLFQTYSYPPPEESGFAAPYPAVTRPMMAPAPVPVPATTTTSEAYPEYLATTVSVSLPGMTHFTDAIKAEDAFTPYFNYGLVPGIDLNPPSPYMGSAPHTPPLTHGFDQSASCSEGGYEYPTTPLSMPSPSTIQN